MKILKTSFEGLLVIKNKKFIDNRGSFREILVEKNIKKKFPFNVVSISKKNVIRGMHYQKKNPQGKYISVIKGKILDVVIDIRKNSKTFGEYFSIVLSEKNCKSVYIPEGFAHGFASLDKVNIVIYSCTNYRNKNSEHGILWNDKTLNIKWPIKKPIISKKDKKNPRFTDHI
ncbi:dTDP-4-dehydrorhamnose 3,5-epimerase [Pelagibacteraceae bacterium]|nr:dTDP-4-dehydrorhamnose 3,5-epimerase [Pelagibacteraceae bacterium]